MGGDRVGGERDPAHPRFPRRRPGEFGAQGVAQGGETGRSHDGRLQPAHPGLGGQRPCHRQELLHQVSGIDPPVT